MATKNDNCIAEFDNKLKINDFSAAYQLFDLKRGRSAGREWKSSVFFLIAVLMFFILSMNSFDIVRFPVVVIVLMLSMYACTHYVYLLPKKAKLNGEHIFKSSHLLNKTYHFTVYRDYLEIENQYESLQRYYSDMTDCIETDTLFVLIGGTNHRLLPISKACLTDKQIEKLSGFFSNTMVRQYRRTKPVKKGK